MIKVCIYRGGKRMVAKSGIGKAIEHQQKMVEAAGAQLVKHLFSADIVHINTVLPDSLVVALIAHLLRKKVVYYGHSTEEDFRGSFTGSNRLAPLFKRWITFCYRRGDIIITPTEYAKGILSGYGIGKPIFAVSNGIDTRFWKKDEASGRLFRKLYGIDEDQRVIISVGHMIERKGILDFISLAELMPDVQFLWFGYTPPTLIPQEVLERISAAPKNLRFPGYVSAEELRAAYSGADLFLFMSFEETEGIVVLEALACGTETLLRDIPVYDNWLEEGEDVYKAGSFEEFRRSVSRMKRGLLPKLAGKRASTVSERSISSVGEKLLDLYYCLL